MRTRLNWTPLVVISICCLVVCVRTQAQTEPDDVVRVNTELVQTDVMVFDKSGKFVTGLKREQFELSVDGKPQPLTFFEQVRAGTSKDFSLRSTGASPTAVSETSAISENRGRTIVFFVDDLHLAPDSLARTRQLLAKFIDNEMNENDRVAFASTSGDIGFLQQFTDYKSVLRAAAGRLTHHPYNVRDMTDSRTPMSEYIALTIERKDDPGVLQFYIDRCLQEAFPLRYKRETCEVQVKSRARLILLQSASLTLNTYSSLESLMRTATLLPGRKLVFFISDGFLLDTGPRNADPRDKLRQITDAALRAGTVIYTIDARGLFSGQLDATNNVPFDTQNRLDQVSLREGPASQDALNALAADTGGRALRNQNYFDRWVNKILDETSQYYLLAWRPNNRAETESNFKNISVRVIDHPEYTVRLPRGFVNNVAPTKPATTAEIQSPIQSHRDLQLALTRLNPKHDLGTSLSAVFLDTPDHGTVLTASVQVANENLSYTSTGGRQSAAVDVAGVVVNDRGKPAGSFQTRLNVDSLNDSRANENSASIYNARLPLQPGLYQVRVATRDINSGRVGSAQQWIEIPDLKLRRLAISSLLLGLQSVDETKGNGSSPQVQFNVDHRFARNGRVGFIAFVYNADQGGRSISFQARLLKVGQPLVVTPWRKVSGAAQDQARILCNGDISLNSIPTGQYTLELTVTDDTNKTTVSEQTRIIVE
jgi:VWFA-related protein